MHRVVTPEGGWGRSSFLRWTGTTAYAMFASAAVLLLVSPAVSESYGRTGVGMCVFILIGALFSMWGSSTEKWVGEFVGTPLLAVGFATLGLIVWLVTHDEAPLMAYANLSLFLAFSAMLMARFRMMLAFYRFARSTAGMGKVDAD